MLNKHYHKKFIFEQYHYSSLIAICHSMTHSGIEENNYEMTCPFTDYSLNAITDGCWKAFPGGRETVTGWIVSLSRDMLNS